MSQAQEKTAVDPPVLKSIRKTSHINDWLAWFRDACDSRFGRLYSHVGVEYIPHFVLITFILDRSIDLMYVLDQVVDAMFLWYPIYPSKKLDKIPMQEAVPWIALVLVTKYWQDSFDRRILTERIPSILLDACNEPIESSNLLIDRAIRVYESIVPESRGKSSGCWTQ